MPEEVRRPPHDREAEPEALRAVALGIVDLEELLEDAGLLFRGDAEAGVDDHDPNPSAAGAGGDEHAARLGVLERVRDQVAEDALEQDRIGFDPGAARPKSQAQPPRFGLGQESIRERLEEPRNREGEAGRLDHLGIEARDVEQAVEEVLHRLHRAVDVVGHLAARGLGLAVAQAVDQETDGMQRLAQVVARGGEEAGLRGVGRFGAVLLALDLVEQPRVFALEQEVVAAVPLEQVARQHADERRPDQKEGAADQRVGREADPEVRHEEVGQEAERTERRGVEKAQAQGGEGEDQRHLDPGMEMGLRQRDRHGGHHEGEARYADVHG
jgi:hypothetical protein